jgi:hypothetical protein
MHEIQLNEVEDGVQLVWIHSRGSNAEPTIMGDTWFSWYDQQQEETRSLFGELYEVAVRATVRHEEDRRLMADRQAAGIGKPVGLSGYVGYEEGKGGAKSICNNFWVKTATQPTTSTSVGFTLRTH